MPEKIQNNEVQISGGISGAISDPSSTRALLHAEKYYEEIRKNHSDVKRIAKNTGYRVEQILMIKHYLFLDEHELDGGYRRFDVSFEIAESWQRLAFDPEHIKPHDLTLIRHEMMEMRLVNDGVPQDDAHTLTSRQYDYSRESAEYYKAIQKKIEHRDGQVSGALTMLGGNTH